MLARRIFSCALLGLIALSVAAVGQLVAVQPPLRDLDSHCPFTPPTDLATWELRAKDLKLQLEVSQGLWPKPELDPVKPKIYGKIERSTNILLNQFVL